MSNVKCQMTSLHFFVDGPKKSNFMPVSRLRLNKNATLIILLFIIWDFYWLFPICYVCLVSRL